MKYSLLSAVCAAVITCTSAAYSATIIGFDSVDVPSVGFPASPGVNMVNNTGLEIPYEGEDFTTYTSTYLHSPNSSTEWFSGVGDNNATITFDLGGVVDSIGKLAFYNADASEVASFTLSTSVDGITYTTLLSDSGLNVNPSSQPYAALTYTFLPLTARYFQFDLSCPTSRCSVGEAFVASVPVPAALPMILTGVGLLGAMRLRRKAA